MGTGRCRRLLTVGGSVAASATLAALAVGCTSASADSHAAAPRIVPTAAAPRFTNHGAAVDQKWLAYTGRLRARVAADQQAPLVLIGDSLTAYWPTLGRQDWQADMAPMGALDLGLAGDTTQNLLWRIDNGELSGLHPRAAVLLIGTNDFAGHWTPAQVTQGILATAERVRAVLPDTQLLLLALLPRGDYLFDPAQIGAVDADLHRAALPAGVTLVDVSARFRALDGDIDAALYQPDRVHLTDAGYQRLAAGIRLPLETLLGP